MEEEPTRQSGAPARACLIGSLDDGKSPRLAGTPDEQLNDTVMTGLASLPAMNVHVW